MQITLHVRTYAVKDAPVALSFLPTPPHQKHTLTRDGKIYDAVQREMRVTVPDGAAFDLDHKLLSWRGDKGLVKSTATEVHALVQSRTSGFRAG